MSVEISKSEIKNLKNRLYSLTKSDSIIGHTKSGKPVFKGKDNHPTYSSADQIEAIKMNKEHRLKEKSARRNVIPSSEALTQRIRAEKSELTKADKKKEDKKKEEKHKGITKDYEKAVHHSVKKEKEYEQKAKKVIKPQKKKDDMKKSQDSSCTSANKYFRAKLNSLSKRCWEGYEPTPGKKPYSKGSCKPIKKEESKDKPFHGYNKEKHSPTGGLNAKYREKYNREHGSHLKAPVTEKHPTGKNKARKKSFCARMSGVKGPTSKGGKLTPKGAALKRWKCSKSELAKSDNEKHKNIKGLMVGHRPYKCLDCGHEEEVSTNHTGDISHYCKGCSWKPSSGKTGHEIPALGNQTYRRFTYSGDGSDIVLNPHWHKPEGNLH